MINIQIQHALPDRIRFKVPAVKNEQTARRLEKTAEGVDGIYWARANSKCGGLVIRFDGTVLTEADILELLAQHVN